MRIYKALPTLPTTRIKAHAQVAARYNAPVPFMKGPASKRIESLLGGASTPVIKIIFYYSINMFYNNF